jgi:hypothetical protein
MAIVRVAVQSADIGHKLAARSARVGGGHRELAAELIRLVRFAFADAFHLGGVQRVDPRADRALLLIAHAGRQGKRKRCSCSTFRLGSGCGLMLAMSNGFEHRLKHRLESKAGDRADGAVTTVRRLELITGTGRPGSGRPMTRPASSSRA